MFGNLFAKTKYSGSVLEKRMNAQLLLYGDSMDITEFAKSIDKVIELPPAKPEVRQAAMNVVAFCLLEFTRRVQRAASGFGGGLDDLAKHNVYAAYIVALCLFYYTRMLEGGQGNPNRDYEKAFPAGILLWDAMHLLEAGEPLKQFFLQFRTAEYPQVTCEEDVRGFAIHAPRAGMADRALILQQLQNVSLLKMLPPLALRKNLELLYSNPDMLDIPGLGGGGGGSVGPVSLPGQKTCPVCNGSGQQNGCPGCNGKGHLAKPAAGGALDVTPCVVCSGTGRARCNFCGGSGKQ